MTDEPREDQLQAYEHGQDIRDRTRAFATRVVELCKILEGRGVVGRTLAEQVAKASNAVAANLEEARAAESPADFISKCCIALKECRESHARLRVIEASGLGPPEETRALSSEANELVAIITAIVRNTKRNAACKAEQGNAGPTKGQRPDKQPLSSTLRIPNS